MHMLRRIATIGLLLALIAIPATTRGFAQAAPTAHLAAEAPTLAAPVGRKAPQAATDPVVRDAVIPSGEYLNWGLFATGVPLAWDSVQGQRDVVIAIIDSGADLDHPDLVDRLVQGYDFVDDDTSPIDQTGTGSAMAGIAAATADNNEGIAGVCPQCKIMPLKVQDASHGPTADRIISAIDYAIERNVQVISLGSADPGNALSGTNLRDAILKARSAGIFVTCPAGDGGAPSEVIPYFPGAHRACFAVGAIDSAIDPASDSVTLWSDSNYGAQVEVLAPGSDLKTTTKNGGYSNQSGTALSSAFVAGMAGLLAQRGLSDDQIYLRLCRQAHNSIVRRGSNQGAWVKCGVANIGQAVYNNGISNGTFDDRDYDTRAETYSPDWQRTVIGGGSISRTGSYRHTGTYSLRLGNSTNGRQSIAQPVWNTQAGSTLTFWYYMKTSEPAGAGLDRLSVRLHDSTNGASDRTLYWVNASLGVREEWTKVSIDLSAATNPNGWQLQFEVENNASNVTTLYLDDIKISGPDDVIRNNGFEAGDNGAWTTSSPDVIADHSAQTGWHTAYVGGLNNENDWLEQTVEVPANYRYLYYSFYLWAMDVDDTFEVRVYNADTDKLIVKDFYDGSAPLALRNKWLERSFDLAQYSGYPFAHIKVKIVGKTDNSSPSGMFVDNVWMSAIKTQGTTY